MIKVMKVYCGQLEAVWGSRCVASLTLNRCARLMSLVSIKIQTLCPRQRILVLLK